MGTGDDVMPKIWIFDVKNSKDPRQTEKIARCGLHKH